MYKFVSIYILKKIVTTDNFRIFFDNSSFSFINTGATIQSEYNLRGYRYSFVFISLN